MLFALETFARIAVSSVMYLLSAWDGSNPGPAGMVRADSEAMDIADAEARADALTDELAKVAAALRRSRRKRRQQHADPKKFLTERLCGFLARLVLTMFQMCGHMTRVPADFLHGHGRRKIRVHGSCTIEDTEEAVEGLYMQTKAAELADLMVVRRKTCQGDSCTCTQHATRWSACCLTGCSSRIASEGGSLIQSSSGAGAQHASRQLG